MPTLDIETPLKEIFVPTLLKVIGPTIVAILIFLVIRIIFAVLIKENRTLRGLVDFIIVMIFIVTFIFVVWPITVHNIKSISFKEIGESTPNDSPYVVWDAGEVGEAFDQLIDGIF